MLVCGGQAFAASVLAIDWFDSICNVQVDRLVLSCSFAQQCL